MFLQMHQLFKRQPHKMVKHTQTTRRQQPMNYLSVFEYFVGLALKESSHSNWCNLKWVTLVFDLTLLCFPSNFFSKKCNCKF